MQQIRLFVASSGDVRAEREVMKRIVNQLDHRYDQWGLDIQLVAYEDDVIPDYGMDAQEVVNRNVRFDLIDIFIGIIWRRIGTPTKRAMSGTVEEVNIAMSMKQQTGRPWYIMFFLCDRPFQPSNNDEAYQYEEAKKFRKWIEQRVLAKAYKTSEEFYELASNSLSMAIDNFLRGQARQPMMPVIQPMPLMVQQISPMAFRLWCPWCSQTGPITDMYIQAYQSHAGQIWTCPRCMGPHFFSWPPNFVA